MNSEDEIVTKLKEANEHYRNKDEKGIMSDSEYDQLLAKLPEDHWYRNKIEPEILSGETFNHPVPMLSTQKAKTDEDVNKWLEKVKKVSSGVQVFIKVTAKLDGMAAKYYSSGELVTRGNGNKGNIVTSAFDKGVVPMHGQYGRYGLGELVMGKQYFEDHLADDFAHPRNVVVGIVMSDNVNPKLKQALKDGVVHFANYNSIYSNISRIERFSNEYREIEEDVRNSTPYPIDGVVIEVINEDIRKIMGSTDHHHNFMIALKPKDEMAFTIVLSISSQTGRTGKVTPVLNVQDTFLDNSVVKRVTAHNFKNIIDKKIGGGSKIGIIRSGGVIPKLETVEIESDNVVIPDVCPSCSMKLTWNETETDLICSFYSCPAQIESKLIHFFNTIGNVDGFGPATVEKISEYGYETITDIYDMSQEEFEFVGCGEKTSVNLIDQLDRSMNEELEDWRFLAAFGVSNLGKGNSKKLLKKYSIENIFDLSEEDISDIEGFGKIISSKIIEGLESIIVDFNELIKDFNITYTVLEKDEIKTKVKSPVSGKNIVFTGKMRQNRNSMQDEAIELGATAQSTVNSKTDYLVTGEKVGQSKIDKAEKFNVTILSESQYNEMLKVLENNIGHIP